MPALDPSNADLTTSYATTLPWIDGVLGNAPNWNWTTDHGGPPLVLTYTFTLDPLPYSGNKFWGMTGTPTAFNAAEKAAVVGALAHTTAVTGLQFQATDDPSLAVIHFANCDIASSGIMGWALYQATISAGFTGNVYWVQTYVYLDDVSYPSDFLAPTPGGRGYQILLHELGHILGLKHPTESVAPMSIWLDTGQATIPGNTATIPSGDNSTANTLMSYNHSGAYYGTFRPYDVAALHYLYGNDGAGGALGISGAGTYLTGTPSSNVLVGTSGPDLLVGEGGDDTLRGEDADDTLIGGPGNDALFGGPGGADVAVFAGARSAYSTIEATAVVGPDGSDALDGVEIARFDDGEVSLLGTPNSSPTITAPLGAPALVSLAEGTTLVMDAEADDAEGDAIEWQVSGGVDAARFVIGATDGKLAFVVSPDFESPLDVGGDNTYDVEVSADDGALFDTVAVAVTVTDVDDVADTGLDTDTDTGLDTDPGPDTDTGVVDTDPADTDPSDTDPGPGDTADSPGDTADIPGDTADGLGDTDDGSRCGCANATTHPWGWALAAVAVVARRRRLRQSAWIGLPHGVRLQ